MTDQGGQEGETRGREGEKVQRQSSQILEGHNIRFLPKTSKVDQGRFRNIRWERGMMQGRREGEREERIKALTRVLVKRRHTTWGWYNRPCVLHAQAGAC